MENKFVISTSLKKRLSARKDKYAGFLLGEINETSIICYSCCSDKSLVPLGLNIIGTIGVSSTKTLDNSLKFIKENPIHDLEFPVHILLAENYWYQINDNTLEEIQADIEDVELSSLSKHLVRARGHLDVWFEWTTNKEDLCYCLDNTIANINKHSFYFKHVDSDLLIGQEHLPDYPQLRANKNKSQFNFQIWVLPPEDAGTLVIHVKRSDMEIVQLKLPLDVLVSADLQKDNLYYLLVNAIRAQVQEFKDCILSNNKDSFSVYHFIPEIVGHPITTIYPDSKAEKSLESVRIKLHEKLCLPKNRPYFRIANRHFQNSTGHCLISPHLIIHSNPEGQLALVNGKYSYHHYLQDKIDDNGWGCAYRSLQTIVSWFRMQGYTDKPIPSHREIQQALVDVGDKQPNFVGSKQWIGSQEITYCLQHLFDVDSKTIFVQSGADLEEKARELMYHFEVQGTPIMIGGGNLAHTILGVSYDLATGKAMYLILDPHYTGIDEIGPILKKGWCGWKPNSFWKKNSFYNLCLPQCPNAI